MTEADFGARLAALGLTLDDKAFAAAFKAAQDLRGKMAKIEIYLKSKK